MGGAGAGRLVDRGELTSVRVERVTFGDVLRVREFRALWLAGAQSIAGDQLARVALSVLVFERTASSAVTALVYGLTYLPAFVGGILLTGLADRFPPRRVMILCDIFRAIAFAAMAVPGLGLPALCVLLVLAVLVGSPFSAAENTLLPRILDRENYYVVGSGLRMITGQTAQLVGFAGGGIAIALIGPRWGLAADAASFAASALIVGRRVRARPPSGAERTGLRTYLTSVIGAARLITAHRRLRVLLGFGWLAGLLVVPEGLAAPYAAAVGGGPVATGLLLASIPAGNAIGVLILVRIVPERRREGLIGVLACLAALALVGCAMRPDLSASLLLWCLSGMFCAYQVQAAASFVLATPEERRGQVFGLAASGLIAIQGAGIIGFGVVAEHLGPRSAIALAGGIAACIALLLTAVESAHREDTPADRVDNPDAQREVLPNR